MIDQTQLAGILLAIAALIGAVAKAIGSLIGALRSVGKKVDDVGQQVQTATAAATETAAKVDSVEAQVKTATTAATQTAAKADKIHDLVDGNASKAAEQIRELTARVETLHQQLMDVMEKRVDDAKAAPPTNPARPLPVVFVDQRAAPKEEPPGHASDEKKS